MITPSLTLLVLGAFMVPGGVLAGGPPSVTIAVIVTGSFMAVLGATFGFLPIRWTELQIAGLKGTIETHDREFRDFFRGHRDRLVQFATLMDGDPVKAKDLVREAGARTRLAWTTGASADPLLATLRTLLHWIESPGLWALFVKGEARRRRRWTRGDDDDGGPVDGQREAMIRALAQLPFAARAALLLDGLLGVRVDQIAELLGESEEQVRRDVAAAMAQIGPLLGEPKEPADAHQ